MKQFQQSLCCVRSFVKPAATSVYKEKDSVFQVWRLLMQPWLLLRRNLVLFASGSALPLPSFCLTGVFVCVWNTSTGTTIYYCREHKRKTFDQIPDFGAWQGVLLVCVGFLGGIFSAVAGSGVDICSFSVLSLLFRVSEKVSTPTSIVLMAINTCMGR